MRGITGWVGPRKAGGTYYSGYWGDTYTVIVIVGDEPGMMTVEWSDGRRSTHCTAWDERRDRIVSEPAA